MTSKEINDMIIDFENQIERFGEMITLTNQLSVLKSYKQDLERLERLKQELKVCEYFEKNLIQQNEKLKKAIEILKDKISISVNRTVVWFETEKGCVIFKIDNKQEYDLLKEVLGNE